MSLDLDETHRTIQVPESMRKDADLPKNICRAARTFVRPVVPTKGDTLAVPDMSLRAVVGVVYYSQWADDDTLTALIAWPPGSAWKQFLDEGQAELHVAVGWGGYYVEMRPAPNDSPTSVQPSSLTDMAEQVHGEG